MNKDSLKEMIDQKYISVQKHPDVDLYIYNYTQKAQFDKVWNDETLMCRGLIMDKDMNIVARPFPKFFNLEEEEELPAEEFDVFEKYDGSLGILYFIGDTPYIATRGSFTSDQAIKGTEILRSKYSHVKFNSGWTYLFEIIYRNNRIVVDYGDMEDLVLLAMLNTQTGQEGSIDDHADILTIRKKHDWIKGLTEIKHMMKKDNAEGFVLRFKSGKRIKIKFDEYVRLHRLVTGVNARRIWDLLRNNQPIDELLDRVPDEFYKWVKDTVSTLQDKFKGAEIYSKHIFNKARELETRKEQAEFIKDNTTEPGIVFAMLDGKDYAPLIWRLLKPSHETPFKNEI